MGHSEVLRYYCKFSHEFYFRQSSHVRSFAKIKYSRNGEIALSFTDIGTYKACPSREFLTSGKYVTRSFLSTEVNQLFMYESNNELYT